MTCAVLVKACATVQKGRRSEETSRSKFVVDVCLEGGPLPVINGVVTPINGLINGLITLQKRGSNCTFDR